MKAGFLFQLFFVAVVVEVVLCQQRLTLSKESAWKSMGKLKALLQKDKQKPAAMVSKPRVRPQQKVPVVPKGPAEFWRIAVGILSTLPKNTSAIDAAKVIATAIHEQRQKEKMQECLKIFNSRQICSGNAPFYVS